MIISAIGNSAHPVCPTRYHFWDARLSRIGSAAVCDLTGLGPLCSYSPLWETGESGTRPQSTLLPHYLQRWRGTPLAAPAGERGATSRAARPHLIAQPPTSAEALLARAALAGSLPPRSRVAHSACLRRPRVGRWAHERARGRTCRARIGQAGGGQVTGAPITRRLLAESTRRRGAVRCLSPAPALTPPWARCQHLRRPPANRA